ncbi:aminopeptidase P family protein [Aquiflexum gelatinilyticum]|uniref:Aminopeptidase P family protein n=1 Tax=Aquiflexum gelatinilyticum TaxID=2961943 RepID=A0A9X2P5M4_9BACT|nr:aminopeptidase P family protein [Aquiflexum gelatinilyticum]MCR9013992.1 aminopeptidase P family protein [Aquiflexum gelatinilyticum]
MNKFLIALVLFVRFGGILFAQSPHILSQREQAAVIDQWLEERIQTLLPSLMDRSEIDMWVIISREYNEDPVIKTFLPATWHAARRRTMLVLYKAPGSSTVETFAVARYDVGKSFKKAWDPDTQPDQWKRLSELIVEKNPKKIGLNIAKDFGHADGLNVTEYNTLKSYLPENFHSKITSAQNLAVGWLETRTPSEMATYRHLQTIANDIIADGLSEEVITPGVTTTDDVVWWYRERIKELKLDTWFHPSVDIQRADPASQGQLRSFAVKADSEVIMPGDMLHIDFGISYLRLNTDTQQLAYVLKLGENEVPQYLKDAMKVGNRLQDILTSQFVTGRTGNQILRETRKTMNTEGIKGSIYSHPLGMHGHASGPTIGMWDNQGDTPGAGDYPLYPNTVYAIELNAVVFLKEWNKELRVQLEEGAFFDGEKVTYLNGRQVEIMPIPRKNGFLNNP